MLCSDLFHQSGDFEFRTESDVVGRFKQMLLENQRGPFADYLPYTKHTAPTLNRLADLSPRILATMHGSTFVGNGKKAIQDLAIALKEVMEA